MTFEDLRDSVLIYDLTLEKAPRGSNFKFYLFRKKAKPIARFISLRQVEHYLDGFENEEPAEFLGIRFKTAKRFLQRYNLNLSHGELGRVNKYILVKGGRPYLYADVLLDILHSLNLTNQFYAWRRLIMYSRCGSQLRNEPYRIHRSQTNTIEKEFFKRMEGK